MVRWVALAALAGAVGTACALDMRGLGAGQVGDEGDAPGTANAGSSGSVQPPQDAAGAEEGGVSSSGASGDDGGDDGSGSSGGADATGTLPLDGAPAADGPPDVAAPKPEAGPVTCDQDGDGHLAEGAACGGDDCCDTDKNVHPGQTAFFTKPGACGGFDYDCSGKIVEQYGAASCSWDAFSCSGDGFAAPVPSCGQSGNFTSCGVPWYDVFTCHGSDAPQVQGCR